MAKLSEEDILKLARLAKLDLNNDEIINFQKEINAILGYVDKLQTLDIKGIEPTIQVNNLSNVMREDVVNQYQATPEDLLATAPAVKENAIRVKRVIQ